MKKEKKMIAKFDTLTAANAFTERATKALEVILGCDGLFWVVALAAAERLQKAGYELAN